MNKKDRGILYGLCFGDGCVNKQNTNKNYGLTIGHGPKQKEYLEHKAKLLTSIFGGKHININTYKSFNNQTSKKYTNLQLKKVNPYFNQIHKNLYSKGKKKYTRKVLNFLTTEGLAYWFMDDGSGGVVRNKQGKPCGCGVRISTYCSKEEVEVIADWFKDVYGLECKFDRDNRNNKYSIRFNTLDAIKFCNIIKPYVLPLMFYKIEKVLNYTPRVLGTPTNNIVGEDIV